MNNKSSGCLALFVVVFVIWILAWILKIGLILGGAVLAVGAPLASGVFVYRQWQARRTALAAAEAREQLAADLTELEVASLSRLGEEMAAWDRIQLTRGVGTRLEAAFFTGSAEPELQRILDETNSLMQSAERQRGRVRPGDLSVPAADRIQALSEIDSTWIQLELKRSRVALDTG